MPLLLLNRLWKVCEQADMDNTCFPSLGTLSLWYTVLLAVQDAAELYEKAGMLEKAAGIYIQTKAFHMAQPLMGRVVSPKLQLQYAKAKESESLYMPAAVGMLQPG